MNIPNEYAHYEFSNSNPIAHSILKLYKTIIYDYMIIISASLSRIFLRFFTSEFPDRERIFSEIRNFIMLFYLFPCEIFTFE